jgi:hypothetical protein
MIKEEIYEPYVPHEAFCMAYGLAEKKMGYFWVLPGTNLLFFVHKGSFHSFFGFFGKFWDFCTLSFICFSKIYEPYEHLCSSGGLSVFLKHWFLFMHLK